MSIDDGQTTLLTPLFSQLTKRLTDIVKKKYDRELFQLELTLTTNAQGQTGSQCC